MSLILGNFMTLFQIQFIDIKWDVKVTNRDKGTWKSTDEVLAFLAGLCIQNKQHALQIYSHHPLQLCAEYGDLMWSGNSNGQIGQSEHLVLRWNLMVIYYKV